MRYTLYLYNVSKGCGAQTFSASFKTKLAIASLYSSEVLELSFPFFYLFVPNSLILSNQVQYVSFMNVSQFPVRSTTILGEILHNAAFTHLTPI